MSAADKVGVGVIGAGFIIDYHLDGLKAAGGATLCAIAARSRASAEKVAARHAIPVATDDRRAIFYRSDVEAVIIATPDDTHREIACAAARSRQGDHAAEADGAKLGSNAAPSSRQRGVPGSSSRSVLCTAISRKWVAARELIAGGKLGKVLSARMRNATPWAGLERLVFQPGQGRRRRRSAARRPRHGRSASLLGDIDRLIATIALRRTERVLVDGRIIYPDNEDHAFATYTFTEGPNRVARDVLQRDRR